MIVLEPHEVFSDKVKSYIRMNDIDMSIFNAYNNAMYPIPETNYFDVDTTDDTKYQILFHYKEEFLDLITYLQKNSWVVVFFNSVEIALVKSKSIDTHRYETMKVAMTTDGRSDE